MQSWIKFVAIVMCVFASNLLASSPVIVSAPYTGDYPRIATSHDLNFVAFFMIEAENGGEYLIDKIGIDIPTTAAKQWEEMSVWVYDGYSYSNYSVVNDGSKNSRRNTFDVLSVVDNNSVVQIMVYMKAKYGVMDKKVLREQKPIVLSSVSGLDHSDRFTYRKKVKSNNGFYLADTMLVIDEMSEDDYEPAIKTGQPLLGFYLDSHYGTSQVKKVSFEVKSHGVVLEDFILTDIYGVPLNYQPAQVGKDGTLEIVMDEPFEVYYDRGVFLFAKVTGWGDYGDYASISLIGDDHARYGDLQRVLKKSNIVWGSEIWVGKKMLGVENIARNGTSVEVSPYVSMVFSITKLE